MDNENLVAIIVLNHNKKNDILECLASISKMNYRDFEVIVVDNDSSDGSAEEIRNRYPNVHLIENKVNLGVAGGRNIGVRYANEKLNYKYLLFLDDDIIIDKNALLEMICSFNTNESVGIVTPKCYMMHIPETIGYAGGMTVNLFTGKITDIGGGEKDTGQFEQSRFISSSAGLCLLSKELLNKVGLFDEKFNPYGWEDVDFSLRAKKNGYKILYNPKAIIYHKGGKKGRGRAINEYEFSKTKNYFYLIRKHANIFQLVIMGFCLPFRILIIILKELFVGEFKTLFAQLRGFLNSIKLK
jgi:GT2 family glycosyltransferase